MLHHLLEALVVQRGGLLRPPGLPNSAFLLGNVAVVANALLERSNSPAREQGRPTPEILENINEAFVALDGDFRFTFVNHAAEVLMAKSRAELIGRCPWDVYPGLVGTSAEANCRRAMKEQRPLHFEHYNARSNRWADVGVYPNDGVGLLILFREITAEKDAHAASIESEERYRFQLEAANVGTWEWDIASGEDTWSPNMESIHGMPSGSFHGTIQDMLRTVHPDDRCTVFTSIRRAIQSHEPYEVEYRTIGKDGRLVWIEAKGRVVYEEQTGKPLRMIGVGMNITRRKTFEAALRDSEARFRTLAKHAPVGIVLLDAKGSCVFVNEYWSARTGMKPEQSACGGWLRAVHPEDRGFVHRVHSKAIAGGKGYNVSFRIQAADGKVNWAETSVVPERNHSGDVTGYIATVVDVTEHRLWEIQLERANKQVTDVLESITEMFIALDFEWRFTYVNQPTLERARRPLEQILGKNIWQLYPVLVGTSLYSQFKRVMAERAPVHFEFLAPGGLWFDVHAYPSNSGLSAYILDVTERKKSDEELSRLAAIVDASNDAIMSITPEGSVLTWNAGAERVYGYSAREMIGRNISILRPPDSTQETEQKLESLKRGESVHNFEAMRIRKDAKPIWISLTASPIRNQRGEVVAISTIARDITEIKALEEQLRQAAKLESLGVMAGGIAHDFNNLLVGILGNASLAREVLPASSDARQMLDGVIGASERAAALTKQLLAYSGKGKFVIQPLDLSDLVRDLTKLVQASISKSVAIRQELAPDLPAIVADVAQLQQVVMNLIINAAEAIGENSGLVTVTTAEQQIAQGEAAAATIGADPITPGRYVYFEVKDNGAGMDKATMARIFDPFFTTKFTGRGLGLSAVLGIVRGHQGYIQVESRSGQGSTFKVLFPASAERCVMRPEAGKGNDVTGSGVILLVDDEDLVRRVAAAMLVHLGYTVLEASNGQEAIELFQRNRGRIRLVILDLSMPVMSGEECLKRLNGIQPGVPVILSSGYGETEAARRCQAIGYLQKPYTPQHLAELVKDALCSDGRNLGRAA
jgi:PAS domain S-box-containing protein